MSTLLKTDKLKKVAREVLLCKTLFRFRNIYLSTTEEACRTWSRCLKCQDEVDYCLECPVGLFGPTCSTISCPDPGPVPNANHINANEDFHGSHRPGQSVKFDCHDGFELQGTSTLTCQESGTWSGKPPFCSRVAIPQPRTTTPEIRRARSADPNACPDPGLLPNGTRTVLRPLNPPPGIPAFPRGSHLKFGCENGFWLEGWDSLVCLTGGKWSSPLPTCRPYPPYEIYARYKTLDQKPPDDTLANCSNPGPLSNGWVRVQKPVYVPRGASISGYPTPKVRTPDEDHYPQDTRLAYSCDKGYWRTGGYSIDCKNTGLWSAKPPKCAKVCGTLLTNRDQDPEVEWPWMVGVASLSNETSHLICGGVLLDDRTVLTAATCFLRNGTFQLLFGKYTSRNQDNEDGVLQRTNYTVKIHPNFNHSTHTADIALVQFSPSITYSDRIQPICLPSNKTIIRNLALGRIGYVTSWGLTKDAKPPDSYMMSRHSVVTMRSCLRKYKASNLSVPVEPETFCAENSEAQTNICNGYGGSPMLFFGYTQQIYVLEGLASLGHSSSCGRLRRYTIFTQVLPYVDWIRENMS